MLFCYTNNTPIMNATMEFLIASRKFDQKRNQQITMSPCIKFQSIWRTLDVAQICRKLYEWQNFEKVNNSLCKYIIPVQ